LLKQRISIILNQPEIKPLYEKGVKVMNEKDILLSGGHTIRPDRLVFRNDELNIIDYKTGQEEEYHRQQLNGYAGKLQQMGYSNIKKYLLYIDEEKVVEV
jgi:CRISPR/Cas system-associated exonuclease Cas4 (RecB family)